MYTICSVSLDNVLKISKYTVCASADKITSKSAELFKKCRYCTFRAISKLVFLKHFCQRTYKQFKCDKCDYVVKNKQYLKVHVERKHKSLANRQWFKCDLCSYKALARANLASHVLTTHSLIQAKTEVCDICQKAYNWKNSLRMHMKRTHAAEEDQKWYRCNHCDYKSLHKRSFTRHIFNSHNQGGIEWHKCDLCDYKTYEKYALKRHVIARHTRNEDIEWYRCPSCDYKVKERAQLNKHIRVKHELKEVPICTYCNKVFSRKASLERHVLYMHASEEQVNWFECNLCDLKFKSSAELRTHSLRSHQADVCDDFKCDYCDYKHAHKSKIITHMRRTHYTQPIKCTYCHVVCKNEWLLKEHIRRKKHIKTETVLT